MTHESVHSAGPSGAPSSVIADVIVVGAGFGGCYALYRMRQAGFTVKILEAGSDFGGVWHFNRYPGARVDSETPSYQFSIPDVWSGFNFRERFPGHQELREYFSHVDKTLHLRQDTIFNTRVKEARYDANLNRWKLWTDSGLVAESTFVLFATGTSNKAHLPDFPGLDRFKGSVVHPASWPEGLDVTGKRIGLIGQGSSGLQILQELAKEDCEIKTFIRTPCNALPMGQRTLSFDETEEMKNFYDGFFAKAKYDSTTAYPYNRNTKSFYDATEKERRDLLEQLWARGGFGFIVSAYKEAMLDPKVNAVLYDFWVNKVRYRMTDPTKRDIVAPLQQFQWFGIKRPNLETDYYEMLDRPNVNIIDLKATPIERFVEHGIVTGGSRGGLHELDMAIVATGYDAVTGSLYDMNLHDRNGNKLQDKWRKGIRTFLGMMTEDLPNAFFIYGPQAPTSLANGPPFVEMEVDWIVDLVKRAQEDGVQTIQPSEGAVEEWKRLVHDTFEPTLYKHSTGWWTGMNVPGKNREPLIFFGGVEAWWRHCTEALRDWKKFVCPPA